LLSVAPSALTQSSDGKMIAEIADLAASAKADPAGLKRMPIGASNPTKWVYPARNKPGTD
jgi:hypothetical protein